MHQNRTNLLEKICKNHALVESVPAGLWAGLQEPPERHCAHCLIGFSEIDPSHDWISLPNTIFPKMEPHSQSFRAPGRSPQRERFHSPHALSHCRTVSIQHCSVCEVTLRSTDTVVVKTQNGLLPPPNRSRRKLCSPEHSDLIVATAPPTEFSTPPIQPTESFASLTHTATLPLRMSTGPLRSCLESHQNDLIHRFAFRISLAVRGIERVDDTFPSGGPIF